MQMMTCHTLPAPAAHRPRPPANRWIARPMSLRPPPKGSRRHHVRPAGARHCHTVVEINQSERTFVLQDDAGHRRQIAAPADMINFPQLKVGDVVDAEITVETLIYVADAADVPADGGEGLAVAAAEGEKPGVLAAQQEQISSATVIAVDVENHSATLELADGSLRTVPVRPDVSISSPQDVGKSGYRDHQRRRRECGQRQQQANKKGQNPLLPLLLSPTLKAQGGTQHRPAKMQVLNAEPA